MRNISILEEKLVQRFGRENVVPEWDVAKNSQDAYTKDLYCPRIDYAVGPFNIDANLETNNDRISREYNKHRNFINQLREITGDSGQDFELNENPRCFLAIEVENSGSRKHRLGSIINASAIGKVGILLAKDQKNFNILTRAKRYLDVIQLAGKTNYSPKNILIAMHDSFLKII